MDHLARKEKPYHHGDLHRAILDAAHRRLDDGGIDAVTIRACARDAGVSPAAPIHHFGSLKGVLSALAAEGFDMLIARLDADRAALADRSAGTLLVGAYVAFAVSAPRLFDLMWRDDVLDPAHEGLQRARQRALDRLRGLSGPIGDEREAVIGAVRTWSLAHGLATLLINDRMVAALGDAGHGLANAADFVALAYSDHFAATV